MPFQTTKLGKTRGTMELIHRNTCPGCQRWGDAKLLSARASTPTDEATLKDGPNARSPPQDLDSEFLEEKYHHQFSGCESRSHNAANASTPTDSRDLKDGSKARSSPEDPDSELLEANKNNLTTNLIARRSLATRVAYGHG